MNKLIKKIFFGKKAFLPIFKRLFDISIEGMNIGTGGRSINENGELYTIKYVLSKEQTPVVFDVGAQGGDYLKEVSFLTNKKAKIYAFEPCLRDYQIIEQEFGDKATIVNSALSDTEGTATLYYSDEARGLSTLHKPNEGFSTSETVEVQTIDNFCKLNNIKNITLLKLDVEGNELACLKGAGKMLPNIKYIQFEFSALSRDARVYFRDIFNILSDYRVYRILRNGLYEIQSPEKITELLFTTNYLAERKNT